MESVFAIVFLLTLLLATVQVVFVIYSRNVVRAAAQEGVRSVIERGADDRAAIVAARRAIAGAAGGLFAQVDIEVGASAVTGGRLVTVIVKGGLRPLGPLPLHLPVAGVARGVAASDPR